MARLKIAFSGMGAVGGYYGCMLAAYNNLSPSPAVDLYFIARGKHLEEIRRQGLLCHRAYEGTIRGVPTLATDDPAEIGTPVDYLFCCTKAYDLEENLRQLAPLIGRQTVLIPLLNGMDIVERIRRIYPEQPVWHGCVYIGARLSAPGEITKFALRDMLFFGDSRGESPARQLTLLRLLLKAGINAYNPEDIIERVWKKFFLISTAATLTSFLNTTVHNAITRHRDLYITLCGELRSVAEAVGIRLPPNIIEATIDAQQMMPFDATTSMHTDFLKGKQTELETLTGSVLRLAERVGVAVPAYRFMYKGLKNFPYPPAGN